MSTELLPFDTVIDISRVSKVASMPAILVVAPTVGPRSVKELIALGKSKPGQLSFGSAGIGGGLHFSSELFGWQPALMRCMSLIRGLRKR